MTRSTNAPRFNVMTTSKVLRAISFLLLLPKHINKQASFLQLSIIFNSSYTSRNQTGYLLKFDISIPRCCAINLHSFLLVRQLRLPRNHKSIVLLRLSSVRIAWIIVRANTAEKKLWCRMSFADKSSSASDSDRYVKSNTFLPLSLAPSKGST